MYDENPSDSGATHATVKSRWEGGDPFVRETMRAVAKVAEDAVAILSAVALGGTERRADRGVGRP